MLLSIVYLSHPIVLSICLSRPLKVCYLLPRLGFKDTSPIINLMHFIFFCRQFYLIQVYHREYKFVTIYKIIFHIHHLIRSIKFWLFWMQSKVKKSNMDYRKNFFIFLSTIKLIKRPTQIR